MLPETGSDFEDAQSQSLVPLDTLPSTQTGVNASPAWTLAKMQQQQDSASDELTSPHSHSPRSSSPSLKKNPFICVFHFAGCKSVFRNKNEWKRHVMSQHMLLYFWLCEIDQCAHNLNIDVRDLPQSQSGEILHPPNFDSVRPPLPNGAIFSRKDLFTQHLRRMHAPIHTVKRSATENPAAEWEDQIRNIQSNALRERCQLPDYMDCPAPQCKQSFSGVDAWDQRMEHVAKHLEKAALGEESPVVFGGPTDPSLMAWATKPEVSVIKSAAPDVWALNNPLRPVRDPREIQEEAPLSQPTRSNSFRGDVSIEQPFQTAQTRSEPLQMNTPTEGEAVIQKIPEKIPSHDVDSRTNSSHDVDHHIKSASVDVPAEGPIYPVPPLRQQSPSIHFHMWQPPPVQSEGSVCPVPTLPQQERAQSPSIYFHMWKPPSVQSEGSLVHGIGGTDLLDGDSLSLPPRHIGTMGTAPTDSGLGTSIPQCSIDSGHRNQKESWYRPFADDAKTVHTDYSDIQVPRPRFNQYSLELASCLLKDLEKNVEVTNIHGILKSLPVLLKAFALRLAQGQSSSSQRQFEVIYFVYRFREAISKIIEEHWYKELELESPPGTPTADDGIPPWEKCESWLQNADFAADPGPFDEPQDEPDSAWNGVSDDEENDMSLESLAEYHKLVCSSPAYSWLLECIRRNASLSLRGAATVSSLADQIINKLPSPSRISRTRPICPLYMQFRVPWNPIDFLRHQGHQGKASHIISKIIALTGQVVDAQATTTEQYLNQTWPATGRHFLGAIEIALRAQESSDVGAQGKVITYVYPDQTEIKAHFCDQLLELDATGSAYSIAEVGEQLGWIMSALQSSSSPTSMSSSRPILRSLVQKHVSGLESRTISGHYVCTLDCVIEPLQPADQQQDGQCWHKLFINPVIVADYPVLPRSCLEPSRGLEVPFDILIALAETPVLTSFGQSTLMKGYSTMLIPVLEICNMIVWHFVIDETGDRLSFLDSRLSDLDSIHPIAVDNHQTRHIVGWCSNARSMTGSPGANYNIGRSGLRRPRVHHTLKSLSLTASRAPIGGGLNFEISKKDKLLVCGFPKGYLNLINFLKTKHVVLYDVGTRCAWLVDGQSAVLHLVRASLEKELKDCGEDSEDFLYRSDRLHNAADDLDGPQAASAVLRDRRNYLLELSVQDVSYHGEWTEDLTNPSSSAPKKEKKYKETYNFFKDRVVEICTSLEKIVDHMNNRNTEDGINSVLRAPRGNLLGGFDFMDIASNKDSFTAREMPLRQFGLEEGWTALASSLGAITLFGNSFGDLIKPVMLKGMRACNDCGFGAAIPTGKDYLVTRSSLVESVLEESGDDTTRPWQVMEGLYWQAPEGTFQSCSCMLTKDGKRKGLKLDDRIQVLYRSKFPNLWNRGRFLRSVQPHGAMIFGHSFLPNIHTGQRDEDDALDKLETSSSEGASRDTMSRSSMLTLASDSGDHTQSTSRTSLTPSTAPTSNGCK